VADRAPIAFRPAAASDGTLRLAVAVRPADALGFRLAGATVEAVAEADEAAAFKKLLGDPAIGVVAVEEELLAAAPPRLLKRARERGVPVVLAFALPRRRADMGRGREYVAALVRRAVGYAVKLGGAGGGGTP
jgi:V/A-type H+-transporting ATPase subunit F